MNKKENKNKNEQSPKKLNSKGNEPKSKDWWKGLGVIVSLLGVLVSLTFSVITCHRNNVSEDEHAKQFAETKRAIELEKLKNTARDWFTDCEYSKSFEYYQKVKTLDPNDDEGYRKFLNMGKNLKAARDGKCDSVIKKFFIRAQQLKKTTEINQLLQLCE
jgi:hypothetical protein